MVSLFLILVAAAAPSLAAGTSTPALDFQLALETPRSASPTALILHVVYKNPSNPSGEPSPLKKSVVQAPPGSVFDGHAIPACTASDGDLMGSGPSACPRGSQVGTGTVSLITGCGSALDPFMIDAVLFNGGNGVIELFSQHGTGARLAVGHAYFTAPNILTENPASQPGCGPGMQSAVHEVDFHFNRLTGSHGAGFTTTPPSCPASGSWISRITATVADGHVYSATSTTPCASPTREQATIRVEITPRRITAGESVLIRIHVRSAEPECVRFTTVAVAHAHGKTDGRGIATLRLRPLLPGLYPVRATRTGCRTGHALLRVTRAKRRAG